MNRNQRIRLVWTVGIGLSVLFVASVGAPLAGVLLWPGARELSDDIGESMSSAWQILRTVKAVTLGSLAVAAVCFGYALFLLAGWFIGPKGESSSVESR